MGLNEMIQQCGRLMRIPLVGYPGTALTGTGVDRNLQNAEVQAETLLKLGSIYGFDVVFPFMDLSVEAEAAGLAIRYTDEGPPDVLEHPVKSIQDLEQLNIPDPDRSGRMPLYADVIRILREKGSMPIGGYASSPFTLAGLLMGAEELAVQTLLDPEFSTACIDWATKVVISYAQAQERAGADMLMLLDPTAVLLSPSSYEHFVQPSVEQVARAVEIPVILHICGQTTPIIKQLAGTAVSALSLDSDVILPDIMDEVPGEMAVMGNINPVAVMLNMDGSAVAREVSRLIEAMKKYPNFILSTGCDVPKDAPLENIEAFMSAYPV